MEEGAAADPGWCERSHGGERSRGGVCGGVYGLEMPRLSPEKRSNSADCSTEREPAADWFSSDEEDDGGE